MNNDIPEPVLPEPAEIMLQMKRNRELVPCQKETLCRRRCRTLRVDTGTMGTLEANRPFPKRDLIARERSERNHARLSFLEITCAEFKHREAAEQIPRRQRTLSDEAGRRRPLLVCRNANDAAANGLNLLTTWSSRPSDSAESRYIPPEVRKLVGTPRRRNRDRRRNRCRNVHPDGKRVHERKSDEPRTVAQCLDGQVPVVRQTRCPQVAKNLEKRPGLAAPLTRTLEETLGACSMVRDRCRLAEQSQHSIGLLVMTGLLSYARPGASHFEGPCRTSQVPWHTNWSPSGWP